MNAWKLTTSIPENRKLSLDIPSDVPVGPVEVILVYDRELVKNRNNTYAIIIGNEDYKSKQPNLSNESNVDVAVNDAKVFK